MHMVRATTPRNRLIIGGAFLVTVAVVVAVAVAALNVRAESHHTEVVGPEVELLAAGNEFPDDFRAEYRLKFGEPDDEAGKDLADRPYTRETHERLVNDGSNLIIAQLTFAPEDNGEITGVPWHTHPGPLVLAVTSGALTVTWSTDCEPRTYEAGQAFVDLGEEIHKVENLSGEEVVVYATAIGIPEGEPLTQVVIDQDDFVEPC